MKNIMKILSISTVIVMLGWSMNFFSINHLFASDNQQTSDRFNNDPNSDNDDAYHEMRLKWENMLTGEGKYDPENPDSDVYSRISYLTEQAQAEWDDMDKSPDRRYIWEKYSEEDSGELSKNFVALRRMAQAYSMKGSELYHNEQMATDILDALDWLYENKYNESVEMYGNWFHWEIAIPKDLNDTMVLLHDNITSEQLTNYTDAIERFSPDPTRMMEESKDVEAEGANRVDKATIVLIRGVLVKDEEKIEMARDALRQVFEYETNSDDDDEDEGNDGFYRDGSFIQHQIVPSNLSYGVNLLEQLPDLLYVLKDSPWEDKDTDTSNIYDMVYTAYEPFIFNGAGMGMVTGRSQAKEGPQEHAQARKVTRGILKLAESASEEDAQNYRSMVKRWLLENDYEEFFDERTSINSIVLAKEVLEDSSIQPRDELVMNKQYPNMDRSVHHRPGWAIGLSMHSERIAPYESMNGENAKGWHTSNGMTYLYNNDLSQFDDNFWPTVDKYRLPGITVSKVPRELEEGERKTTSKSWVGGTSINNRFGVNGMSLEDFDKNLSAKKSWFMFDDEMVALGSGINDTSGEDVETIVENRKIHDDGDNALIVDGEEQSPELDWSSKMNNVNWAHLEGNTEGEGIGYYFPEEADLNGLRESRTGSWSDLYSNEKGSTKEHKRNFLTLWYNHGKKPEDDTYSYVLLPNKTSSEVANYAASPDINVIENSTEVQAVEEKSLNLLGANFWTNNEKTVDIITSRNKASVMMKSNSDDLEVSISDPTQKQKTIEIEIDRVVTDVISKDSEIDVVQEGTTTKLIVDVDGSDGMTFSIKFDYPSATSMKDLVNELHDKGEIKSESTAHDLEIHLTSIEHYEKQEKNKKAVKHMEGLIELLDYQYNNEELSTESYDILKANSRSFIKKYK